MKLRLVAIESTCRMEMAAGARVPSEHLRALAKSAGLHGETLDDLCAEARRKIEAAFAEAFT